MKTVKFKKGWHKARRLRPAGKQLSIDRVVDHFQGALLYINQFGYCAGLAMGFLSLTSFLLHAAHSGAEKGVI